MGLDLSGFRAAIGFLTRVPMGEVSTGSLGNASRWFPTVGALIGLAIAGFYILAIEIVPALLAAIVAVTFGLFLTGGLHEDGLADAADAFGSGTVGDRALEIMRDSRLGTYGTLALIISVGWRVAAVASLNPVSAVTALVLAGSMGRTGAVILMGVSPTARPEGVGHQVALGAGREAVVLAITSAGAIGLVVAGLWAVAAAAVTAAVVIGVRIAALRRVGGVTGDILGACEQLVEVLVLTLMVVVLSGRQPWWA